MYIDNFNDLLAAARVVHIAVGFFGGMLLTSGHPIAGMTLMGLVGMRQGHGVPEAASRRRGLTSRTTWQGLLADMLIGVMSMNVKSHRKRRDVTGQGAWNVIHSPNFKQYIWTCSYLRYGHRRTA